MLRKTLHLHSLETRAVPATFTVSTLADAGPGSLRQALADAASLAGADTVDFATNLSGQTIRLASELQVADTAGVTVVGGGAITVSGDTNGDGSGDTRIINVAFNARMTLDGLRLSRGRNDVDLNFFGGAITNYGDLSITGCTIENSTSVRNGGGIWNAGTLTVANSVISGNSATRSGGGVECTFSGTAVISDSTITNNMAYLGGGIEFSSTSNLTLNRVVISGNSGGVGGGVAMFGVSSPPAVVTLTDCTVVGNTTQFRGAGVNSSENARLTITTSTISGNVDGDGVFQRYGELTIRASTISGNGGNGVSVRTPTNTNIVASTIVGNQRGVFSDAVGGSYLLTSSIVAGNTSDIAGVVVPASSGNLIGDAASAGGLMHGVNGNIVGNGGSGVVAIQSIVSPLANNGGLTQTHALVPGSPAINAGVMVADMTTDQRGEGFARVVGVTPDIGAFEFNPQPRPTATVAINGGAVQRSKVNRIEVAFSDAVTFPNGLAAAIRLSRVGPGGPTGNVALAFSQNGNVVSLTVTDPAFLDGNGTSLIDGRYVLTLVATKIVGAGGPLDGNGDGVGGDSQAANFHRLYGDANGDASVNAFDFGQFRTAFGSATGQPGYVDWLDFDGDGAINALDFGRFRNRFGLSLP